MVEAGKDKNEEIESNCKSNEIIASMSKEFLSWIDQKLEDTY